jgi:Flp pilus assembly protein TadG
MRGTPSQGTRRERGQALVETALSAMIILFLLLGLVDFGLAFGHRVVLANAARAGARFGSRYPDQDPTIRVAVIDALRGTLVLDSTYDDSVDRDDTVLGIVVACTNGSTSVGCGSAYRGHQIRVTVTYQYEFIFGTLLGLPDVTLGSSAIMFVANPPAPTPNP